jgi:outer membrane biosynthesis protein TonB
MWVALGVICFYGSNTDSVGCYRFSVTVSVDSVVSRSKIWAFSVLYVASKNEYRRINVRKQVFLWGIGLLFLQPVWAQDPAEYQKWLKKQQEEYQDFKDARDKEFVQFLSLEWKQMKAFTGLVRDENPKPAKLPVYQPPPVRPNEPPKEITPVAKDIPAPKPDEKPRSAKVPADQPPTVRPSEPPKEIAPVAKDIPISSPEAKPVGEGAKTKGPSARTRLFVPVDFYGMKTNIGHNIEQKPMLGKDVNKGSISAFWAALSRSEYDGLVSELLAQRDRLGLNDWGYCQLVYQWCKQLYSEAPTANSLYYITYFTIGKDNKKYYAVPLEGAAKRVEGVLYSYDGSYPGVDKKTDFSVKSAPVLNDRVGKRDLKFEYGGRTYSIPVEFNRDAVSFFEYYPQTNFEVYFTSSASSEATRSLVSGLKPIVSGISEIDAVNILLRFVQTAFEYQTDQEQFGREKPFFPEETLYYPYSDCEDRSILFAYLVRKVLGLDVVGLDYPAHIATAVRFGSTVAGDAVTVQGTRYVICDPTYINALAGMCMPQFKSVSPNIITFTN